MSQMHRLALAALLAGVTIASAASNARAGVALVCESSVDISTFDGSTNVSLVGDAAITSGVLRVTPATEGQHGAAWYGGKIHVSPGFDTTFTFQISNGSADGFAFIIQDDSNTALGGGGGAIGYGAGFVPPTFFPGITRSVAIEFDTFGGPPGEFETPHVSVQTNGVNENDTWDGYSLAHATVPPIADGQPHVVHITYTPGNLKVLLDDVPYIDTALDLQDINGDDILDEGGCAWMGFTGATGAATADQDILNWSLNPCVQNFNLATFTPASVTVAGAASVANDLLTITPNSQDVAGSAWYAGKVHLSTGFDTTFTFQILGGTADGFAFVIQDESDAALGGTGSSLGYADGNDGSITRSLAVEFDTFSFGPPDNFAAPHVSIQTHGVGPNSWFDDASLGHASIPIIDDEQVHTARIKYASGALNVWLDSTLYLAVNVDLQDIDGNSILDSSGCAWIGFAGATGSATAEQNILSWSFKPPSCLSPPCERNVIAWRSVRTHSGIGPQSISLHLTATGNGSTGPTVETRSGGIQRVEADFDGPVTLIDPTKLGIQGHTTTNGVMGPEVGYLPTSVEAVDADTIALLFDPGVLPDQSCYTMFIFTAANQALEESIISGNNVRIRSLVGDTTGNGRVTLSDALYVKRQVQAGQTAAGAPGLDVDLSGGSITNADALGAKSQVAKPAHQALCP